MTQRRMLVTALSVVTCLCLCWAVGNTAAEQGDDPQGGLTAVASSETAPSKVLPKTHGSTPRGSVILGDNIHSLEASGSATGKTVKNTNGRGGGCTGNASLTQSVDPVTLASGNLPACGSGTPRSTTDNAFCRSFDLATTHVSGMDFTINCVEFGVGTSTDNSPGVGPGFTVQINVFEDTDGGAPQHPTVDLNLLGTVDVFIPDETELEFFEAVFAPPIAVLANTVVVVEIWADDRGSDNGQFYPGSNSLGETGPSYLRAADCGIVNYTTNAAIGFPDGHLVMTIFGDATGDWPTGACCIEGSCAGTEIFNDCAQCGEWFLGETCPGFQCGTPCLVPCDPSKTPEGEPQCTDEYEDAYNAGCEANPPVFQTIGCGARICGESGTYIVTEEIDCTDDAECPEGQTCDQGLGICTGGQHPVPHRDNDWYELVLDQEVTIEWTVEAEFPVQAQIRDGGDGSCTAGTYQLVASVDSPSCDPLTITRTIGPGIYWLTVRPSVFDCVTCGNKYNFELQCYGRDRFPSNLEVVLEIDGITPGPTMVALTSTDVFDYATVLRDPPPYATGTPIQTEMVSMSLVGSDPILGPITVIESPRMPSTGQITDVVAPGGFFQQGNSFFDMWPEIELGNMPDFGTIITKEPHHLTANGITDLPPWGAIYEWPPSGGQACKGDMDGDNDIDGDDIRLFINCLLGLAPPPADCQLADMDKDGDWDMADVFAFVDALLTKTPCPRGGPVAPIELHVWRCSETYKPHFIDPDPNPVIPDVGSVSDTYTVNEAGNIADLNVDLHLAHDELGDLTITIEHLGTVVTLWDGQCSGSENMDVLFDDNAAAAACASPVVGDVVPAEPLAAFNGLDKLGDWIITITDNEAPNCGFLLEWSLHFCNGTFDNIAVGRIHSVRHIVKQPPPVKCEPNIHHNGEPDEIHALSAERRTDDSRVYYVIDDVTLGEDAVVEDLHWWTSDPDFFNWTGTADVIIVEDLAGVPGATLYEFLDLPALRAPTGREFSGDLIYNYEVLLEPGIFLPAGTYWFGMRPVQYIPHGGPTRWMTAPLTGSQVYVDYGNVPGEWVPGDSLAGWEQYGVAFCVTGQMPATEQTSSCCLPTGCTVVPTNAQPDPLTFCEVTLGGTWHVEPCTSTPPPCDDPIGACCYGPAGLVIEGCEVLTQADCNTAHPNEVVTWTEGEDCSVCRGRCCFEAQETCSDEYEWDCNALSGAPDVPGTTCDALCSCAYSLPPNDDCEQTGPAPLLQLGQELVFTGNNSCATEVGADPYGLVVWIAFELDVCMDVTIHACDNPEPIEHPWIYLLENCAGSTQAEPWSFDECACGPNFSMPFAQMIAGTYYYPLVADPSDDPIGDYIITVVAGDPCGDPPPNDTCEFAIEVLADTPTPYTTALANTEYDPYTGDCGDPDWLPGEVNCGPDRDIFFAYLHSGGTAPVCFSLCATADADYDPMLSVHGPFDVEPWLACPTVPDGLTPLEQGCDDDFCSTPGYGAPGRVLTTAERFKWYLVRVGGCGGSWGSGELLITVLGAGELCGPELGRCCYIDADGVQCVKSTQDGCTTNVNGIWTAGQDCPTTPQADCPPVGRCCYMQGGNLVCADSFEVECVVLVGEWTEGLTCADACPPLGTCCLWDVGTGDPICLDATSEAVCTGAGGIWNEGLDCTADAPCPSGQCCYDPNPSCVNTSEAACVGFWSGAWDGGLTCATPCPPIGKCCYDPAPSCVDTTEQDCLNNLPGGIWTAGEDCTNNPCPF